MALRAGRNPRQEFHLIALEFKAIAHAFLSSELPSVYAPASSETRPDQHGRTWVGSVSTNVV